MIKTLFHRWINLLPAWCTRQKNEIIAGDIARQCKVAFEGRIFRKGNFIPGEQIRGYIRAYAGAYLESVVQQHLKNRIFSPAQLSKITSQAKEQLIEIVVREIQSAPPIIVADVATAA